MNRILHFIPQPACTCCAARRQLAALEAECLAIEADVDGVIDFWLPGILELTGDEPPLENEDGTAPDGPMIQFRIKLNPDRVPVGSDLRRYAFEELSRIGYELIDAASRLEGTAQA